MTKQEMILSLGNALVLLNRVQTEEESNLDALLTSIRLVKKVYKEMKEEKDADNHDARTEGKQDN